MAEQPDNRINDDLLAKFLAGETDSMESAKVSRALSESEEDRLEFERFTRIWDSAALLKNESRMPEAPIDTDAAWLKIKQKMGGAPAIEKESKIVKPEQETIIKPLPVNRQITWRTYWRIAAAVVLILGLGWQVWKQAQPPAPIAQVAVSSRQETVERILPDGSRVLLNKNSRLSYPGEFATDSREVVLNGEAFFDVKPDPSRPFRITAKGTTVQVLGTSFSVRAYDENVRVAVRTGKVQFKARKQQIVLKKDEQASFDAARDTIRKAPRLDVNALAYQTGSVVFENDRLEDIVRTLSETYRTEIRLGNPQLATCRLTTRFDYRENVETVLTVTAESLGLKWRREGTAYILDGESCK